jgi:hypothetical protein
MKECEEMAAAGEMAMTFTVEQGPTTRLGAIMHVRDTRYVFAMSTILIVRNRSHCGYFRLFWQAQYLASCWNGKVTSLPVIS